MNSGFCLAAPVSSTCLYETCAASGWFLPAGGRGPEAETFGNPRFFLFSA